MTTPTPTPTAPEQPTRASTAGERWRTFGAPALALVTVAALCMGALLGWLAFSPHSPGDDSADAGFARDMREHHAQAVEMSGLIMPKTDDEDVRRIALEIATSQSYQRGEMASWLAEWGLPLATDGTRMVWMEDYHHGAGHSVADLPPGVVMPGMASPEEIQALTDATGQEAEVLFMQLMVTHHISGIEMAEAAVDLAVSPQVRTAAQRMVDTQASEISLMNHYLGLRDAEPREDVTAWLEPPGQPDDDADDPEEGTDGDHGH